MYRRQQQARSNSIGDHDFGLATGGHQRLKQSIYAHQSPYVDANQYYGQRTRCNNSGQLQSLMLADRSISPMHFGGRASELGALQRGGSIKYPPDRQPRNQLHASLECLNVGHTDYANNQKQPFPRYPMNQQQQQQQYSHPHQHHQTQHYAASYLLAPVQGQQNNEQDLAAAAMGNPPPPPPSLLPAQQQQQQQQQYSQMIPITSSSSIILAQHSNYHNPAPLSRNSTPLFQSSPLHRRVSVQSHSSNQTNTNSANPIRGGHSSLTLASSTYLIEDKLQHEIKKLESELKIEKEKNEALNSQLSINSNLMAAFEQSLNTLNTRVRQLSAINERKDKEIAEMREQLDGYSSSTRAPSDFGTATTAAAAAIDSRASPAEERYIANGNQHEEGERGAANAFSENDSASEGNPRKIIEDLRRQLIEKDRLLTDTRLEALSAAHQLEQLEARLSGDRASLLANEEDLDEGVMVVNHSPSDSEIVTDSAHFSSEMNCQIGKANEQRKQQDNQSNHSSSDYYVNDKSPGDAAAQQKPPDAARAGADRYNDADSDAMNRLLDTMLVSH